MDILVYAILMLLFGIIAFRAFAVTHSDAEIVYRQSQVAKPRDTSFGCLPLLVALFVAVAIVLAF
jgi:hypothetical protein